MNEQFFSKIDDNVTYWIGFIAADGSVDFVKNRLSFGLSSKDIKKYSNEEWLKI